MVFSLGEKNVHELKLLWWPSLLLVLTFHLLSLFKNECLSFGMSRNGHLLGIQASADMTPRRKGKKGKMHHRLYVTCEPRECELLSPDFHNSNLSIDQAWDWTSVLRLFRRRPYPLGYWDRNRYLKDLIFYCTRIWLVNM